MSASALRALAAPTPVPRNLTTTSTLAPFLRLHTLRPSPIQSRHHSPILPIRATRNLTTSPLTMSSFKYEYLVTIPDVPGTLEKRLVARPTHLANLKPLIESGQVVFGGATLAKQPADGEAPDMTGSCMLIKANSEQEVKDLINADEYAKAGTWDISKAQITAFKCAVRTAI